jgi:hypothetical protein
MMHEDRPSVGATIQPSRASGTRTVFRRDLPGGGFVAVEVTKPDADDPNGSARTRVSVECRSDVERRIGHQPPVIAEAVGDERSVSFGALYRLALSNSAVAQALLEWRAGRIVRAD